MLGHKSSQFSYNNGFSDNFTHGISFKNIDKIFMKKNNKKKQTKKTTTTTKKTNKQKTTTTTNKQKNNNKNNKQISLGYS